MGIMHVLGPEGDVSVEWDAADAESVAAAKEEWDRLSKAGFEFFNPEAKRKRRLKKFPTSINRVLAVPAVKTKDDKAKGTRRKAMAGGPNVRRPY